MSMVPDSIAGFSGDAMGAGAIFAGTAPADSAGLVVARLNALLRGEISAAETYRNVLDKAVAGNHANYLDLLRTAQAEHARVSQVLRSRIVELGGEPAESSGAWGVWAQAVQGTLSLFGGETGGLHALREGEDHGLKDYEGALNEVDETSAQLIQNQFIPTQQKHLAALDRILQSAAK